MQALILDPGKSTGFAIFTRATKENRWEKSRIGVRQEDEALDLFAQFQPERVVIEKFRLFPWKGKNLAWDQLWASQIIGAAKLYCRQNTIVIVEQTTDNRDIGYMHGQVPRLPKSNPANHAHDAWAHGCYWVINTVGGILA